MSHVGGSPRLEPEVPLQQAVCIGGPWDGRVLQVQADRPRVIAIPKEGGGYVLDEDGQLPRVYVWRQIEKPVMGCRPILIALALSIPLWVLLGLGVAALGGLLGWWS